MTTLNTQTLRGTQVIGSDGSKLGKVQEIYADNQTNRLDWAEIKTGLFGNNVSLVPLSRAQQTDEGLRIPFDKETVKGADHHEPGRALGADEEARLFRYYGIPYGGDTVTAQPGPGGATAGGDGSRRAADDAMTRSEEKMVVGTSPAERGRVRLHKYVDTEDVRQTVPVSHEEARITREPITDANRAAAMSGPEISEGTHEAVLHEEQPVVEKRTVPKERVRLETEQVTEDVPVEGQVRRERIEMEGDEEGGRRR